MYLPEDDIQLFEILSDLRIYASQNSMPRLSEHLDDALAILAVEALRNENRRRAAAEDAR